jgi:hypothetical protein
MRRRKGERTKERKKEQGKAYFSNPLFSSPRRRKRGMLGHEKGRSDG